MAVIIYVTQEVRVMLVANPSIYVACVEFVCIFTAIIYFSYGLKKQFIRTARS